MNISPRTKIPFLVIPLFAKQNPHSYYFKGCFRKPCLTLEYQGVRRTR
jgi:hypothetical protein